MTYKMKCCPGDEPRIEVTDEFIEKNSLKINIDAAKKVMDSESIFLGFDKQVAIDFLTDEDAIQRKHEPPVNGQISDVKEATQDFLDYMVFAWSKATNERGISAMRSVIKLGTWMKILSRPDVAEALLDDDLYTPYGRPALREACEMLGIQVPDYL